MFNCVKFKHNIIVKIQKKFVSKMFEVASLYRLISFLTNFKLIFESMNELKKKKKLECV